jgi:phosphate transport system substrate-binding protein
MALYPKASIRVEGGGTLVGLSELLNGRAEVAVVSRDLTEEEIRLAAEAKFDPFPFKFAIDGLAVVVHEKNPVEDLTLDQLRDLFSGRVGSWAELGGADVPVVVVTTTQNAGAWEFFRGKVLEGRSYARGAYPQASEEDVVRGVEGNVGAIGFAGLDFVKGAVRAVGISPGAGLPAVKPTRESILKKEYPLIRFFSLVTRKDPMGLTGGFVSYVTSAEGQKMVVDRGYLPATMPVRVIRLTR